MTSVRTVTTVQTTGSSGGPGDNNLDALLEDLQTSVGRTPAVNGVSGNTKIYREVTRTVKHETKPGYQQQVEYLQPANTTTVVAERVPSPGIEYITQQTQPGMTSYKTVSYEYNTSNKTKPVLTEDPNQDARLRQNLTELDSLLVDLHQAQRAGFGSDQGGRGRSRSTDVVPRGGIDPGLLEVLDSSSPAPPARQQHVSRVVQERTYHTYNTGAPRENTYSTIQTTRENTSPSRYQTEPSPRLQPKRSSSVNRELVFNESSSRSSGQEPTQQRARSPSPLRREPESPHVPRRNVHKEVYYETKTSTTGGSSTRQPRSTSTPHERYRDKSPSNQRLHREVYGYENQRGSEPRTGSVPASPRHERYTEVSPPSQRRNPSPSPTRNAHTTVRSYNYSTTSNNNTTTHTSPRPYRSPSPITNRSPGVENAPIIELPRRSPSPNIYQNGPNQPPTKVTTTVRTYTYELPGGQPGSYPPGTYPPGTYPPGTYPPGTYTVQEPTDYPDRPLTYQVSPNPPKEREPLIQPAEPTVITYKYSSHSSRNTNVKYPPGHGPDDQQNLLPRPFPTPSPTPGPDGQPPKQLDELMASFTDTTDIHQRHQGPPPGYLTSERQASEPRPQPTPEGGGVAVVAPTSVKPSSPTANNSIRNRGSSKNVAGPPVYYPPGVELFAHKDQEAKMMSSKASGEYEYSRESQSKGSSGGAAVVPVCLPLCCAMPCVIM